MRVQRAATEVGACCFLGRSPIWAASYSRSVIAGGIGTGRCFQHHPAAAACNSRAAVLFTLVHIYIIMIVQAPGQPKREKPYTLDGLVVVAGLSGFGSPVEAHYAPCERRRAHDEVCRHQRLPPEDVQEPAAATSWVSWFLVYFGMPPPADATSCPHKKMCRKLPTNNHR